MEKLENNVKSRRMMYLPRTSDIWRHVGQIHWLPILRRRVPITNWLANYRLGYLPYDLIAGFTVGLTLVPQCLVASYAALANVRSEFGLYTSFFGQFVYCLFGSSKDGSVGPTAITAMMLGQINAMSNPLVEQGDNTHCALIAFISGIVLMAIGILNLGFIVSLFSIPIVSGFTSAAGFIIIASQMKLFFGLKGAPNDYPAVFVKQMKNIYDRRDEIKGFDVLCAFLCTTVLFTFQYTPLIIANVKAFIYRKTQMPLPSRFETKFMEILSFIVASRNVIVFLTSTGTAYACSLYFENLAEFESKLSLVGRIKPGLPSFQFPATQIIVRNSTIINGTLVTKEIVLRDSNEIIKDLSAMIIIVPLMTMLEQFAITKALARKNGYTVDPKNELVGIGLANFFQSFVNGFPATTTISRCALNDQCKVKTQLASIVSGLIVVVTLAALTPVFYYIPKPTLAAIMCCAGYNLVDVNIAIHMWHECRRDVFVLVFTFCLCLFYDIAYGILIALLLSMVSFLRSIIAMPLEVTGETMKIKGMSPDGSDQIHRVTVIRLPHGMEYPSCDRFIEELTGVFFSTEDRHIIIDCRFITNVDYSGIQAFRALLMVAYKKDKHIIFTDLRPRMQEKFQSLGLEHFKYVRSVEEAVEEHFWASNLTLNKMPSLAGVSAAHISSIVVDGSTPMPSVASQRLVANPKDPVEINSALTLHKPITEQQLGNAWCQPNCLCSASLASCWTAATVGHFDSESVNDWYKNSATRFMTARHSMTEVARRQSLTDSPPTITRDMVSSSETRHRRLAGLVTRSDSSTSEDSTSNGVRRHIPVLGQIEEVKVSTPILITRRIVIMSGVKKHSSLSPIKSVPSNLEQGTSLTSPITVDTDLEPPSSSSVLSPKTVTSDSSLLPKSEEIVMSELVQDSRTPLSAIFVTEVEQQSLRSNVNINL